MSRSPQNSPYKRVRRAFDRPTLKRVCEADELDFAVTYDLHTEVVERAFNNVYFFGDRGSDILFVAHLDTVVHPKQRRCAFVDTAGGPVVYSGALDDRLGAYIGLELLPSLGIQHDILLTVGEESGQSTAEFFDPKRHHDRDYNWMIEFDRGGTDVVMYQYEDPETVELVSDCGARVEGGIFSDISYLEHLEIKGFNWGVGYQDYHGPRSHAYLDDTYMMVGHYLKFHEANADLYLPHDNRYTYGRRKKAWLDDDYWERLYDDHEREWKEYREREHQAWLEGRP
jgi:hypothetical protein